MAREVINVGAAPNDGQGDPIRTAYIKTNNNFAELYSAVQLSPPSTLLGSAGNKAGMIAYSSTAFYYCFQDYDGSSEIWGELPLAQDPPPTLFGSAGNKAGMIAYSSTAFYYCFQDYDGSSEIWGELTTSLSGSEILNGTSNVSVAASSNVTVSIAGVSNVAVFYASGFSVTGNVNVSANVTTGNVSGTTGTFTNVGGTLTTVAQNNITSVGTLTSLAVTGNITSGNVQGTAHTGTTGTFTGNVTTGNVSGTTGAFTNVSGTLTTAAQTSITSVGTLTSLAVTGNATVGNISATNLGNISSINLTGSSSNVLYGNGIFAAASGGAGTPGGLNTYVQFNDASTFGGNANFTYNKATDTLTAGNIGGTLTTAAQTSITSVGTLGSLAVTGNITSGNLSGTSIVGTLTTAAQTNITSVGTLTSLAVTGNITSGNVQGTTHSGTTGTFSGNVTTGNVGGTTGAFTNVGGTLTTAAQTNITSVGTLTSLAVTGNITSGNIQGTTHSGTAGTFTGNITAGNLSVGTGEITVGNIVNANGNGIGNIGSSTLYFNTVFAQATSAQYADLAEMYRGDRYYSPGTVVCFGGPNEVTIAEKDHDVMVAGIVSTRPAYTMNSTLTGTTAVAIALAGRVPCNVQGPILRGQMLVTAGNGRARAELNPAIGTVIGKALQDFNGSVGVIEIVVGRL